MNIYKYDIVFQEVPHHISLAFYVCGCPLKCSGCHSPELWPERFGTKLSRGGLELLIKKYHNRISCLLFLGGEWHESELCKFLQLGRSYQLKTALYTGLEQVSERLEKNLDYLKTGPWIQARGGLASPTTNQIFKDLNTQQTLNHLFQHNIKETSL